MKKIILISLLTLGFVPVRCEVTQQQEIGDTTLQQQEPEKLYIVNNWFCWQECKNLGDKREELLNTGLLFKYEDTIKIHNALSNGILTILSLIGEVVSAGSCTTFMVYGFRFGFDKMFFSNGKVTAGDYCMWTGVASILFYIARNYYFKCFDEGWVDAEEVIDRFTKKRLEYRKKRNNEKNNVS